MEEKDLIQESQEKDVKEQELAQRIVELIKKDDVDLFAKELEETPSLLSYKLGILPIISVCALLDSSALLKKLTPSYTQTNTFNELPLPQEVSELLCSCISGYEELYSATRFIEPSEILLLRKQGKLFKSFLKKGGIKTVSARKRIETLLDSLYQGYTIKAKGDFFYVNPPQTPKRKAFYAVSIITMVIIVALAIILPLTLRVNVVYYCLGEEYGKENGLTGKDITIESPARDGYLFLGWFDNEECQGEVYNTLKIGVEKLYAGWRLIEFEVALNSRFDDFDGANEKTLIYSKLSKDELPVLSREGYLFIGWYDEDGKRVTTIKTDKDISLTAKYKSITGDTYTVTDGEDFLYLSQLENTSIELGQDIELNSEFLPLGYLDDTTIDDYSGLNVPFNGNGHKVAFGKNALPLLLLIGESGSVKNLEIECSASPDSNLSLSVFGYLTCINKGLVENVKITFTADDRIFQNTSGKMIGFGSLVGNNLGSVKSCSSFGNIQVMASGSLVVGGIVGVNGNELSTDCVIEGCTNELTLKSSVNAGGICGLNFGNIKISQNKGKLTLSRGGSNANCFLGGITADSRGGVYNCDNTGEIYAEANQVGLCVGGIVGLSMGVVSGCNNSNNVSITRCDYLFYLGGIAGNVYSEKEESTITLCKNKGKLSANGSSAGWVGGITASASGTKGEESTVYAVIERCINMGEITDGWATGGLIGTSSIAKLSYSRNEGKVNAECELYDSKCYAGGLIADAEGCEIEYCINIGEVSAFLKRKEGVALTQYANIGGLAGILINSSVNACVNSGELSGSEGELIRIGELFAIADSVNNGASLTNVLGLEQGKASWYACSSEVNRSGVYTEVDENGDFILTENEECELYSSIAELYSQSVALGGFKSNGDNYPIFDWEE